MLTKRNLIRGIKNPALALVLLRRMFPWNAIRQDPECSHLIRAWSSGSLDRLPLGKIFPGVEKCDIVLRKPESRIVGWSLDLQELVHLLSVMKLTKAAKILEIGTFDGFSALNLAANLGDAGQVRTLDLPQGQDESKLRAGGISNAISSGIVGAKYRDEPESARILQLWGDSTKADWLGFGAPFDLILIDGCHDYPYVRSDSLNAIKHVRPGGTIFWHDYGQCADVSRAVDELALTCPIKAIRGTRLACLRMAEGDERERPRA
jgi:predicted O-methyltransferase YrrM